MATEVLEVQDGPPLPQVELVAEDDIPLETDWHRWCISLLVESVIYRNRGRKDYYAGGNQFIYFDEDQARNRNFRGPDFYYVQGTHFEPLRKYWCVWQEGGLYPDVIIELLSRSTAQLDRTVKKEVYRSVFRTPAYYCYDPDTQTLEGWHEPSKGYLPLAANEQGRLWCEPLQLWLGTWQGRYLDHEGTWLRFYDNSGQLVPTPTEAAETQVAQLKARVAELEQRLQQP